MMLSNVLLIAQIVIAILLIVMILLQAQGTGLSISLGGQGGVYRSKRGVEKTVFIATILLGILFFITSLALLLFS